MNIFISQGALFRETRWFQELEVIKLKWKKKLQKTGLVKISMESKFLQFGTLGQTVERLFFVWLVVNEHFRNFFFNTYLNRFKKFSTYQLKLQDQIKFKT
jgi:hypothetical protein